MAYAYPPAAPTISGDVESINRFLQNPLFVARRLRTLMEQRFIADAILTGRFDVAGGAILYETGESIYTDTPPVGVTPGADYPKTTIGTGQASMAHTVKWGQDALVTDEAIKRLRFDPVSRALIKLANQNVKTVDSIALSAVASAISGNTDAATNMGGWTASTGEEILSDVTNAVATIRALNQGYEPDTVVVDDFHWAFALSKFASAGWFARETNSQNPTLTGVFPQAFGLNWLPTPNLPDGTTALVLDSKMLGGMADEMLGGPGYSTTQGLAGVEVKTMRDDDDDQWVLRCRRVTVPVVIEPGAGFIITGV